MLADKDILQHIVGTWLPDPTTDTEEYKSMTIRSDGSFSTAISTGLVQEGTWLVKDGAMRLTTTNVPTLNGFRMHSIEYVDAHKLVCGIDISVAGRMRFTK